VLTHIHLKSVGFLSNSAILAADLAEIRSFHFHARGKNLVYKDGLFFQINERPKCLK